MSLQITNLSKHYGDVAVFSNVSLTVARGEFVAIVVESGVGKSTLLNCMAGLDSWDTGTVSLGGTNLGALTDDQRAPCVSPSHAVENGMSERKNKRTMLAHRIAPFTRSAAYKR